jgi:hypothetical protein
VPADIPVAWEYSSYLMAATSPSARDDLRAGGHIRVTLVLARVSPRRGAGWRRCWRHRHLLCGFLAWAMAYFTWRSFDAARPRSRAARWSGFRRPSSPSASPADDPVRRPLLPGALGLPLEDVSMRAGDVAE